MMPFLVAQIIQGGDCFNYLPWWLCAAFRTQVPPIYFAVFTLAAAVGYRLTVDRVTR